MTRLPRGMLVRPRLYARLGEWAPLTVVRGFQGTGKTTLVAGWLNGLPARDVLSVWMGLERDVGNGQGSPAVRSWDQTRAKGSGWRGLLEPAVATFSDGRSSSSRAPYGVLVIDDAGCLSSEQDVLEDLVALVQRHENLQLILVSRGRHALEDVAAGSLDVNVINADELMLTVSEIVELADAMGVPVGAQAAERIHAQVGGWIAPVRLALQAGSRGETLREVFQVYLRQTVLPALSDDAVLRQLERLALADELTLETAAVLLGDSEDASARHAAVTLIDRMRFSGLCEVSRGGAELVLALRPLIRANLRQSFELRDPDSAAAAHRRLAYWYRRQEHVAAGAEDSDSRVARRFAVLEHAVAGRDWTLAGDAYSDFAESLTAHHSPRLSELVLSLPAEALSGSPRLRVAVAEENGRGARGKQQGWAAMERVYLTVCSEVIAGRADALSVPDLVHIGTGHVRGLLLDGRLPEAVEFGAQVEGRVATETVELPSARERAAFLLHLGLAHSLLGDSDAAGLRLQRVWELRGTSGSDASVYLATTTLAMDYALRGNSVRAATWLERSRALQDLGARDTELTAGVSAVGQIATRVMLASFALDRLDQAGAREALSPPDAEHDDDESSAFGYWPNLAFVRALYALHFASPVSTLAGLAAAQAAHARLGGVAVLPLIRVQAELLIAAGEGQHARHIINTFVPGSGARAGVAAAVLAVPRARIYLLSGDNAAAQRLATSFAVQRAAPIRTCQELQLLAAVASQRQGNERAAAGHMRAAFELYEQTRALRTFATVAVAERDRLLQLAGVGFDDDDAATLGRQQPLYPDTLALISLTKRERALLHAMQEHTTRHELAAALFVSPNTVKFHLSSLYRKFGTAGREETLIRARELDLITGDDADPRGKVDEHTGTDEPG